MNDAHLGAGPERHAQPGEKLSRFRPRYRNLSPEEVQLHDAIKTKASELEALFGQIPPSREVALALTKLEESIMWAIKAATA